MPNLLYSLIEPLASKISAISYPLVFSILISSFLIGLASAAIKKRALKNFKRFTRKLLFAELFAKSSLFGKKKALSFGLQYIKHIINSIKIKNTQGYSNVSTVFSLKKLKA